ncbi:hypothetical protein [Aeromicrobium sp.]|uniref:hypothetical protein n=1 Tax=Aeromicrobium sp. TaxID=1871063 RepID=UPI003C6671B9
MWVPSTLRNGVVAWNVFPMRMIQARYSENDGTLKPVPGASPRKWVSPFERVPALVSPEKVAKSND